MYKETAQYVYHALKDLQMLLGLLVVKIVQLVQLVVK